VSTLTIHEIFHNTKNLGPAYGFQHLFLSGFKCALWEAVVFCGDRSPL
jgi:hypothetical protein